MIAFIEFWATVLSPIVGVVAIIVALIVSRQSAKDASRQIAAIHGLLDVVVAAPSPVMADAKHHYEQQIAQLNGQIREAEFDLQTEYYPFFGRGVRALTTSKRLRKRSPINGVWKICCKQRKR